MVDFLGRIAADSPRLARSKSLVGKADAVYNIIALPKFTFVVDVFINITTAYGPIGDATATIGFTGNGETADPDGFMTTNDVLPGVAGLKSMRGGAGAWAKGKWFNSASGQLTITLAKNSGTTLMVGQVLCLFYTLH